MKNFSTIFALGLPFAVAFFLSGPLMPQSDLLVGTACAQVSADFQISTIFSLWGGSAGAIVNTMTFNVTDFPGTGEVQSTSSGANPIPVELRALVSTGSTVTLLADSSGGLTDGATTIPFDEVRCDVTGGLSAGRFSNSNAQQSDQFTDSASRSETYAFYYDNGTEYPTGTYTGAVTYTLSSP